MTKILIVEDEEVLLKMYLSKFQLDGFQMESAVNGEEGVEKAKITHPDLILMDIMMPKMNGIDAVEHLKNDETTKTIPIVMLTNLSSMQDVETAISKGATSYIIKSNLTPRELVDKVHEVLTGIQKGELK